MPTDPPEAPVVTRRPKLSERDAEVAARARWGLEATARELPSERDRNFALTTGDDRKFVLKVANAGETREALESQNRAMKAVAGDGIPVAPRVIPTPEGDEIVQLDAPAGEPGPYLARLVDWIPGKPLVTFRPHLPDLLRDLGRTLARIDIALVDLDPAPFVRDLKWDLRNAEAILARHDELIADPERSRLVARVLAMFRELAAPRLHELRTSVVHNDANDHNLLVDVGEDLEPRIVGVLDFGDAVHSFTVAEVAIAAAYAMLDKRDPLAAAGAVAAGYDEVSKLDDLELDLLFPLVCARLAMSVTIAAEQTRDAPDNDYLRATEPSAWELLGRLVDVHPRFAAYELRAACGREPCPRSPGVAAWIAAHGAACAPVLGIDLRESRYEVLDLSVDSPEVSPLDDFDDVDRWSAEIRARLERAGAEVGIGRYAEPRLAYTSENFATAGDGFPERRTVHIGIDLFVEPGTEVRAPLAGVVAGFAVNDAPVDYGPTIVLRHDVADEVSFLTLYGHLAGASLDDLEVGRTIEKGAPFARIGAPPENGGWPPHLHFQVICDPLDWVGDFPGVAAPGKRALWQSLSPDPGPLLGLRPDVSADRHVDPDELLARRREHLSGALSVGYARPIHIVRGAGAHLYDAEGRRYLDLVNNVCHVGHCHPRVVRALHEQAAVLNTNTRYLHELIVRYAERLAALLPDPLEVCFLVCSGSEANELALRLARAHTGERDVIVLDGAYHGNTGELVDVSPYKHDGPGGAGAPDWVQRAPTPDPYRGLHRGRDAATGERYAAHVHDVVEELTSQGRRPAAFLAESLLGCAGQIVPPDGFLSAAYRHVRAAGGVCIADEVQIGFGRTGTHLWGFETQGVVPDVVTLGKPIGNGHPLAAVVTTEEIARSFETGMEYFNTFGGNPVSCAVGLAVLDAIEQDGLQEHARELGAHLTARLSELQERFELIGDVRGLGLFLGVELVHDREAREPATGEAGYVVERLKDRGFLLSSDGPQHNVLKIKPPLVLSRADADRFVDAFADVLAEDPLRIE